MEPDAETDMPPTDFPLTEAPPFSLRATPGPLFRGGTAVSVRVRLAGPVGEPARDELHARLTAFARHARAGSLAGAGLVPARSGVAALEGPAVSGATASWTLVGCDLDEGALAVLVNLLAGCPADPPVADVLLARGTAPPHPLRPVPDPAAVFPARPRLDFPVYLADSETDQVRLRVVFAAPLTPEAEAAAVGALGDWVAAVELGGYAVAGVPAADCGLIADDAPAVYSAELEWTLEKVRADPAMTDALLAAVQALSARVAPIVEVEID